MRDGQANSAAREFLMGCAETAGWSSGNVVSGKIRAFLDRFPWVLPYGVLALTYGRTQGDAQTVAAAGLLACACLMLRRVYTRCAEKKDHPLTPWIFSVKLFVFGGAIASAAYALYLTLV